MVYRKKKVIQKLKLISIEHSHFCTAIDFYILTLLQFNLIHTSQCHVSNDLLNNPFNHIKPFTIFFLCHRINCNISPDWANSRWQTRYNWCKKCAWMITTKAIIRDGEMGRERGIIHIRVYQIVNSTTPSNLSLRIRPH